MGRTKPETIADLKVELDSIRKFEGIVEKSLAIFYYKSIPFLHFHAKDEARWADVKTTRGYKRVSIPPKARASEKKAFLSSVKKAYDELAAGKAKK